MILSDQASRHALRKELAPHLNWDPRSPEPKYRQLEAIYDSLDDERVPGGIIPSLSGDRRFLTFSAVADNPMAWRRLAPLVMASVGTTLTDFHGVPRATEGPVGSILSEHHLEFGSFSTPSGDRCRTAGAVKALERLILTLRAMPVDLRELPRSAPQILHEFDLAVSAGDREASIARLRELDRRRSVDSLNLRFLTVRWHAAFRQWRSLREERWFSDVCQTRRPPQVTIALLHSLYEIDLDGGSRSEAAESLLARFRTHISPEPEALFRQLLPSPPGPAAMMLALDAVSRRDEGRITALRKVSTNDWDPDLRYQFQELLTLGPPPSPVATYEEQTLSDSIHKLARGQDAGQPITHAQRMALQHVLAQEDEPLGIYQVIRTLVGGHLTAPVGVDTLAMGIAERAEHKYQGWVTDSWNDWFAALPHLEFQRARNLAQRIAEEVSIEDYIRTSVDRDSLIRVIEEALSSDEQHATLALPHLSRWMINDRNWPRQEFKPLYRTLLTAFLLFDSRTVDSFRSALSILDGWLNTGPDDSSYAEVLDDFSKVLGDVASRRSLDALIDLSEMLVVHPAPSADARMALWSELQARLLSFRAWMTPSQVIILNGLCDVIAVPRAFELEEGDMGAADPVTDWAGTIGLYTLRPTVGQRVVHVLRERIPAAKVDWRDDHAASRALRQVAAGSDIMAIDWSAAKHAATDAIRKALGTREPLWVSGGASSMVTSMLGAIEL